jgi:hypothetical protein
LSFFALLHSSSFISSLFSRVVVHSKTKLPSQGHDLEVEMYLFLV